jgi:O-antigen ligase
MLIVGFSVILTWLMVLRGTPRGRLVAIGLVFAMIVAVASAPGVFWQRMQTVWSDSAPTTSDALSAQASEDQRRDALMASIQYTLEHPVFGLGLGNFGAARGTATGVSSDWLGSHNTFTEISSEAGVPALLIFLVLLGTSIRSMSRIGRAQSVGSEGEELNRMARATFVSLIAFIFGAFFAHISYEYYLYYPIAIAAGIEHLSCTMRPAATNDNSRAVKELRDVPRVETA